jgi:hypothetical protein
MIRAAALWLHFVEVERPEVAEQRLMPLPKPASQPEESGDLDKGRMSIRPVANVRSRVGQ